MICADCGKDIFVTHKPGGLLETDHVCQGPDDTWRDDFCMRHGEPRPCRECRIVEANGRGAV